MSVRVGGTIGLQASDHRGDRVVVKARDLLHLPVLSLHGHRRRQIEFALLQPIEELAWKEQLGAPATQPEDDLAHHLLLLIHRFIHAR